MAGQDIVNRGGSIAGGTVGLQAGRDVRNESLAVTESWSTSQNGGSSTALSNAASIVATGKLGISAGRDLVDLGGTLSGGSAFITAGNDIRFETIKTGSTYQSQISGYTENNSSVTQPNSAGMLSNTTVNFFGPAFNAVEADGLLASLQSRWTKDSALQSVYDLKMQNHFADIIGVFNGGNPGTGGIVPEGSSLFVEKLKVLFGDVTVHNCYGNGGSDCKAYWEPKNNLLNVVPISSLPNKGSHDGKK